MRVGSEQRADARTAGAGKTWKRGDSLRAVHFVRPDDGVLSAVRTAKLHARMAARLRVVERMNRAAVGAGGLHRIIDAGRKYGPHLYSTPSESAGGGSLPNDVIAGTVPCPSSDGGALIRPIERSPRSTALLEWVFP